MPGSVCLSPRYNSDRALTEHAAVLRDSDKYRNVNLTPQYYLSELATAQEIEVLVSQSDFEHALAELVPSVSEAEMAHYREVQVSVYYRRTESQDR